MSRLQELKRYNISKLEKVKFYGRNGKAEKDGETAEVLFWTGSGFEVNVTGTELWAEFITDYNEYEQWILIEINGCVVSRQMLNPGKSEVCLFRGRENEAVKNVRVFKEVQAMPLDENASLLVTALKTDGKFKKVKDKKIKIEFIGDSITSGEGIYGAKEEEEWISMWFSCNGNYAFETAKALNADFRIISQSGWGVVCGWDNDPSRALPKYYEKVCGVLSGKTNKEYGAFKKHDFKSWQPDVVVINLGTNDSGAFEQPEFVIPETGEKFKLHKNKDGSFKREDIEFFEKGVYDFLVKVRKNNPKAEIIWVYGMLGTSLMEALYEAEIKYKADHNDKKVYLKELDNNTPEITGARQHPGKGCHKKAAEKLTALIKEIL